MTMVLRANGAFTAPNLTVLSRDSSLGAGAKFATNVHDSWAFPSQSAIATGTSNLLNFVDNGVTNAVITSPTTFVAPNGGIGFGSGTTDVITLPASARIANDGTNITGDGLYVFWIKSDVTQVADTVGVAGWFDSALLGIFDVHLQAATTSPTLLFVVGQQAASGNILVLSDASALGVVQQYAISIELNGGSYKAKVFKNGVQYGATKDLVLSALPIPTARPDILIGDPAYSDQWLGQFYRTTFDDLSAETPETIVARDFAAFNGQFV